MSRRLHVPIAEIIIKRVIILSHAKRSSVRAPRWKIFGPAREQHTHIQYKSGAALTITSRAGGGLVDFAACTYTIKPKAGGYCLVGAILGPACSQRVCLCGGGNESPQRTGEKNFLNNAKSLLLVLRWKGGEPLRERGRN